MKTVYPHHSTFIKSPFSIFMLWACYFFFNQSISFEYVQIMTLYYSVLLSSIPIFNIVHTIYEEELIQFDNNFFVIKTLTNYKGNRIKMNEISIVESITAVGIGSKKPTLMGLVIHHPFGTTSVDKEQWNFKSLLNQLKALKNPSFIESNLKEKRKSKKFSKKESLGFLIVLLLLIGPLFLFPYLTKNAPEDNEVIDGNHQLELTFKKENFSFNRHWNEVTFNEIQDLNFLIPNPKRGIEIPLQQGKTYTLTISEYDYRTKIIKSLEPHIDDKYFSWSSIEVLKIE